MTVRELPNGYELDDDAGRVDVDAVWRYLSLESYWANGRSLATTERLVREAARVVGVYEPGGALVGFCRIGSDEETFAFLFDVFILAEHRRKGLGLEMVREAVERGRHARLPFYLGTRDGHGLYRKVGFDVPNERQMMRPGTKQLS
ncbi:MAG: hypothetical protein QOI60_1549 [Actinomycetota bacterium]|nr:hypothetical protein [Actinomycetota bacterium]